MKKESKLYRLVEMYDSMNESIENVKKVKEEQKLLIDTLENCDKADKFAELIEQLKYQLSSLEKQLDTLMFRAKALNDANVLIDTRQDCADVTNLLINALGIFDEAQE